MEQNIIKQSSCVIKFDKQIAQIMQADKIYYSQILNEPAIDDYDFKKFVVHIEIAKGIKFEANSNDLLRLKDILLRCEELGWSKVDFQIALDNFLDKNEWKSFTRAEFMKYRPDRCLKNHSWFEKETDKDINNRSLMEGFEIDFGDIKLTYWRYKDGVELPLKRVYPISYNKFSLQNSNKNGLETFDWNLGNQYLKMVERNVHLENYADKMKIRIDLLEKEIEINKNRTSEFNLEINRLNKKCLELLNQINEMEKNTGNLIHYEVKPLENKYQDNEIYL